MRGFLAKLADAGKDHSHLGHLMLTSLFVASAVHLVEHRLPLDVPARKLVSQWAAVSLSSDQAHDKAADSDLAVLKIDRDRFVSYYGGQSPLSRCKLHADIKDILAAGPHLRDLAIDFDLSPTGRPEEDACARDILRTLHNEALDRPVVPRPFTAKLIAPIELQDRLNFIPWLKEVQDAGICLADPDLRVEVGMVHRHRDDPERCPGLGVALNGPCEPVRQQSCLARIADSRPSEGHDLNIDFLRFERLAQEPGGVEVDAPFAEQLQQLSATKITRAILGPGYDRRDLFVTPLRVSNGVDVHAAIALNPHFGQVPLFGYAIDIALGILFGAGIQKLWRAYFAQRLQWKPTRFGPKLAYFWIVALLLSLSAGVVALTWLSSLVYLTMGLWISPTPMAVGMLIDGLVLGSVHAVLEQEHTSAASEPEKSAPHGPGEGARFLELVPFGIWFLVVVPVACGVLMGTVEQLFAH